MHLEISDVKALMQFFIQAGRTRENAEAWVHAMIDLQESYKDIQSIVATSNCTWRPGTRLSRTAVGDQRGVTSYGISRSGCGGPMSMVRLLGALSMRVGV